MSENRLTLRKQSDVLSDAPVAQRRNKYAGECGNCHLRVEAEHGRLIMEGGQWSVYHFEGRCGVLEETPAPPVAVPRHASFPVPEGRYSVSFADGTHKTLKISRQSSDDEFMPDLLLLAYLSGSNNDGDYTRFGHVDPQGNVHVWKRHMVNESLREAVKVLIGSPQAAALAYAEHSGCCARCGRTLTVPASIHAGYGPDCAGKVSW